MGKELSQADPKDPKRQMEDAFNDMKAGFERKIRAELGPRLVDEFIRRIEFAVERCPKIPTPHEMKGHIREVVKDFCEDLNSKVDAKINSAMGIRFDTCVRQMWGDFIQKEVDKQTKDPALVFALAKKLKEIM